jgi:DNA-binding response OmpR family regulator
MVCGSTIGGVTEAYPRLRVLVVEDEFVLARFLRRALLERGHECTVVNSGAIAMLRLDAEAFDVVVSDFRLGQESGAEVLKKARARQPDARRVLMSGALFDDADGQILADACLLKPFTLTELFDAIEGERGPAL